MRKIKCTCFRMIDGRPCFFRAKHEIKFDGVHIGYACNIHAKQYGEKALFPLEVIHDR